MHKILKFLIEIDLSFILASGLFTPIYAIFAESIGASILDTGIAWAIYGIITGILILFFGKIENNKNKINFMLAGYILTVIGFVGYFLTNNIWQLFIVQAILGVATAITIPAWDALFTAYLKKDRVAEEWGKYEGYGYITAGIGGALGGLIVSIYGFKTLFLLMSVLGIIGIVIIYYMIKTNYPRRKI